MREFLRLYALSLLICALAVAVLILLIDGVFPRVRPETARYEALGSIGGRCRGVEGRGI